MLGDGAIFKASTVARMSDGLQALLSALLQNPEAPVASAGLLSASQAEEIGRLSCGALRPEYFDAPLFHEGFLQQATAHSKKPCMTFQGQTLSYAEVEARATALARLLMAQGVGPNTAVGLMLDRSHELVIALLAILLAGGAPSCTISLMAD